MNLILTLTKLTHHSDLFWSAVQAAVLRANEIGSLQRCRALKMRASQVSDAISCISSDHSKESQNLHSDHSMQYLFFPVKEASCSSIIESLRGTLTPGIQNTCLDWFCFGYMLKRYFSTIHVFMYQLLTLGCLQLKNIFVSFQRSSLVNVFFPRMRATYFSCFCWQSIEIQCQNIKII